MLALALLGGGRPLLDAIAHHDERSPAARAALAATGDGFQASVEGRTATVTVDRAGATYAPLPPAPSRGKRTALIVGINRARKGRPLPGSVTDATNLRDALLGYGFMSRNITTLLDGEATAGRIRSELAQLAQRTPADGVAVFAVATHTRKRGGQNEFLTADGLRISASELGRALGAVRSKMWVALPTCYAGGYAVPGIIGHNRIATFASSSSRPTYQLGSAGSYLMINMVRKAMLEGRAPESVERSFTYAQERLQRESPNRVPTMSDGIRGELVLGHMSEDVIEAHHGTTDRRLDGDRGASDDPDDGYDGGQVSTFQAPPDGPDAEDPEPSPEPQTYGVKVCSSFDYRCDQDDG